MANFASIRTAISTKLATVSQLQQVISNHSESFTGYPAATFEPSGNANDFYANTDNLRAYAFDLFIWQPIEDAGRANAINALVNAVDAVIAAFDADFQLANGGAAACDWAMPTPSAWGEVMIGNALFKYAKISLVAKTEITVVS